MFILYTTFELLEGIVLPPALIYIVPLASNAIRVGLNVTGSPVIGNTEPIPAVFGLVITTLIIRKFSVSAIYNRFGDTKRMHCAPALGASTLIVKLATCKVERMD